ncbi:hypothetical protein E3U25_18750 [Paracoccus versutus]|uniref:Uncharacterized protein n=2 Tax=Paracoccus versutus TaxID=34007 RepID=A0A3D9XRV6_PARVE|nr:hypothetical protein BDD41_2359 [Paracoccus versutus]WGR57979.1 hypothetical protein E3U25_18750 [Paracoccus versutus]
MMREIIKIRLGASDCLMRPTFAAYGDIETRLGPLRPLYTQILTGSGTLAALACIVTVGMRQTDQGDGRQVDEQKVAKMIFEAGPWSDDVIIPIGEYLAALGWTPEQKGKIEAEAERLAKATPSA